MRTYEAVHLPWPNGTEKSNLGAQEGGLYICIYIYIYICMYVGLGRGTEGWRGHAAGRARARVMPRCCSETACYHPLGTAGGWLIKGFDF